MIDRAGHLQHLRALISRHPVVGLLGARQVGKTTLAREVAKGWSTSVTTFDLEDPRTVARLQDPMLRLEGLRGLVVLDEIQRVPELFPVLRVLADRPRRPARFLVLGSASPELLRQTSESLAGRIAFHQLPGLSLAEVGSSRLARLWLRGGFPPAFTARSHAASAEWRDAFITTFLERDLPQLGIGVEAETLRRFWTMLAHSHGNVWNASAFARSFGVSNHTVGRYLDVFTATFLVRQLRPWHENVKKRQVKSPKVYFQDSGLLHAFLNLETASDLESHPALGASWEGFALSQVIQHLGARSRDCWFWATHAGAELDLLIVRGRRRLGFEFKRSSAPTMTRSMHSALQDLKLTSLDVIHAGNDTFPMAKRVRAVALSRLLEDLAPL